MTIAVARVSEVLSLQRELAAVEFKGPGPRAAHLQAKVIRAMFGMANRRDGGLVVIGVDDTDGVLTLVGVSDDDMSTWRHDHLADAVATYADPHVDFALELITHETQRYVWIEVQQFNDIPVLCKKSYEPELRAGALYVRTRRKPETTEVAAQADMRDVLEIATELRLRSFLATARRAGVEVGPAVTDARRFEEQLPEGWS